MANIELRTDSVNGFTFPVGDLPQDSDGNTVTVSQAILMIKTSASDANVDALVALTITQVVSDAGVLTNDVANRSADLTFTLQASDVAALTIGKNVAVYGVSIVLADGHEWSLRNASGFVSVVQSVVHAS